MDFMQFRKGLTNLVFEHDDVLLIDKILFILLQFNIQEFNFFKNQPLIYFYGKLAGGEADKKEAMDYGKGKGGWVNGAKEQQKSFEKQFLLWGGPTNTIQCYDLSFLMKLQFILSFFKFFQTSWEIQVYFPELLIFSIYLNISFCFSPRRF